MRAVFLQGLSFALFYAACAVPPGRLADVSNRKRLVAAGMVVWTSATALCGLAGNFAQVFCAPMLVGARGATLTPSTYSMIADLFRPQRLALPCGVYAGSSFIGSGVALLLGGMILAQLARSGPVVLPLVGEPKIWQVAFLCAAALSSVVIPRFFVAIAGGWLADRLEARMGQGHLRSALLSAFLWSGIRSRRKPCRACSRPLPPR